MAILNVDVDALDVVRLARGARRRGRTPPRGINVAKLRRRRRGRRRRRLDLGRHVDVDGLLRLADGLADDVGDGLADGIRDGHADGVRDGHVAIALDDGLLVATGTVVVMATARRGRIHVDGDDVDGLRVRLRETWRRRRRRRGWLARRRADYHGLGARRRRRRW